MTENVLTPFEESPWFPCQLLKISDSRCNLKAAGPHRAAAPVVSLPLACRTEYSHWHGPSVLSCLSSSQLYVILCVCVFLAKSLLPTPEVNDMQDHPGKMFDITLILTWYYCPVKPRPNHPDISKHIQTIQFHAIRTLSWTSSKHQCPTCCNYGTVASNLEKPMTQSKEWTSGLAGRLASANDTSFL